MNLALVLGRAIYDPNLLCLWYFADGMYLAVKGKGIGYVKWSLLGIEVLFAARSG